MRPAHLAVCPSPHPTLLGGSGGMAGGVDPDAKLGNEKESRGREGRIWVQTHSLCPLPPWRWRPMMGRRCRGQEEQAQAQCGGGRGGEERVQCRGGAGGGEKQAWAQRRRGGGDWDQTPSRAGGAGPDGGRGTGLVMYISSFYTIFPTKRGEQIYILPQ